VLGPEAPIYLPSLISTTTDNRQRHTTKFLSSTLHHELSYLPMRVYQTPNSTEGSITPAAFTASLSLPVEILGEYMARSRAERLRVHEQHKARLTEQATRLKNVERKVRTRRLIEAGALIEKVGLLDLDTNVLYGALLSLREGVDDNHQIETWSALGGRTFAHEARLRDARKEAIVLTFPAPLAKDATAPLRAAGFRFNRVMQHWEGLAHYTEAERLASMQGGTARRIATHDAPIQPLGVTGVTG
jgi:hypothetical protein